MVFRGVPLLKIFEHQQLRASRATIVRPKTLSCERAAEDRDPDQKEKAGWAITGLSFFAQLPERFYAANVAGQDCLNLLGRLPD
jgi:hypothetical protein